MISKDSVKRVNDLLEKQTGAKIHPPPEPEDPALASQLDFLLGEILVFLKRYIIFPDEDSALACALWIAHTWAVNSFDFSPYLQISSPVKECGKTRLFRCLENLCANPWFTILPSEAVLFRKIAAHFPTLLLDETDTLFTDKADPNKEGIRAVLNSGFERGAVVPRCVGQDHKLQDFPTFCPKAFAGIGKIPETVESRSIRIMLHRRRKNQPIEKFRKREVVKAALPIQEALKKWHCDPKVFEHLRDARPVMPSGLGDRSEDICEPLFAIADLAGGEWPVLARQALVRLRAKGTADDQDIKIQLLGAIREIVPNWGDIGISTEDLLAKLVERDDGPWGMWWHQDVVMAKTRGPGAKLAKLLKPFGIVSRSMRLLDGNKKGYPLDAFDEAFERYLPPFEPESPPPSCSSMPIPP